MHLPRITIVTPSFNQAMFLEQAIRSVLDQNYPNLQYGVVDGGSTDGSTDIINRYRERLDFAIIEKDHGQSDAINKGLRRADGEILGWLNSDDLLLPGTLDTVGRFFAEHPQTDWLIGESRMIDADGSELRTSRPHGDFTLAGALLRPRGFEIPQPSAFWRAHLTDRVGLLDQNLHYCMDFDLWCRFLAIDTAPTLLQQSLSAYRLHQTSKSCAQPHRFIAALIDIEKRYKHLLPAVQRYRLSRLIGYQNRKLALDHTREPVWKMIARRPWWVLSAQVRQALWNRRAA